MTFKELVGNAVDILQSFILLSLGLGLIYFMWGVTKYLLSYDNEKARTESVKTITYGLIALFVMVAVWGLVKVLSMSLLGTGAIGIPQF
jgi:hypothetical protein